MKNILKWILVLATLVALVCVMAGCDEEAAVDAGYKIGWNTDGTAYYDIKQNTTMRMHSGEYYRARFAVDGEQIDLFFQDEAMMTVAEKYMFVALKYDENNVVTDCRPVDEVTGGMGVWNYYIESVTDTELVCNSAANYKGAPLTIRLDENTKTYNIGGIGLLVGLPGTAEAGGRVYAVLGHNGVATHLFVAGAFQTSPVYWNVERKYDSTSKMTSRERDELGYFVYDMVVDGEPVQFRTMNMDVANQIDSFGAKCMHLVFDEEGNIIEAQHARNATGGNTVASWYHVTDYIAIENAFTAEKFSGSDKGAKGTFTMANACKVYDMSGKGAFIGEETEIRVGDQVHGLSNSTGEVIILFVVSRNADVDLYYNLERCWNNSAKVSTRKLDANGWYHFDFSVNGERVHLKTQDANVVYTIDERAACVLGLELEGDVIKAAYKPSSVNGRNNTAFDYTLVTEVDGKQIVSTRNGKTYKGTMSESCEVYNVSSSAGVKGEKTTVQVGDTIYGLAGMDKKVNEIYVTKRSHYSHLYWNLDRNYDTTNKVTKRTPDAGGYYWFRFVDDGKLVTYKTNSQKMANQIDSWVAIGMQYDDDLITKAFKYDQINGIGGGFGSWEIVQSISGNTLKTTKSTGTMSSRVKVYNVSASAIKPGELTKLKVGDRIHGVKDTRGKIMYIFVVNRAIETDLYYNVERMWENNASTRTPDADGFYHFTMSVNGAHVELKTDDANIVKTIDGRVGRVLGLALDGDVILAAYTQNIVKGSETTTFDWAVVQQIREDGTIVATRNGNTYTGKPSADCEIYNVSGAAEMIGEVSTVEVGDTLYGFSNSAGEVTEIYVVGRTPKTKTKTAYCAYCDSEVTWSEWLGTDLAGGHFFLDKDVDISAAQLVAEGTVTCLDLNGHTATGKSTLDRMFNIYGVFNLFDTKKADGTFDGGLITTYDNSSSTRVGNIFYIQNTAGAEFNMYGGNLISTGTVSKGKIGGITRTMNIYDGTISGGKATGYGGALRLEAGTAVLNIMGGTLTAGSGTAANGGGLIYMSSGKVNMSGGKLVGGKVGTNGGVACIEGNSAVFTMSGGIIEGGTATNGGAVQIVKGTFKWTGGTIIEGTATSGTSFYITSSSSKLILSNTVSVNGVYVRSSATIVAEGLNPASRIGLTMEAPGVFMTCADKATAESLKESFVSQMAGYVTVVNDTQLLLGEPGTEPQPAHSHCVCGGNTKGVGDHTSCTTQTWEPWTGTWVSGKYYYLTEDYNLNTMISVNKDQVLNLCLNGHKINGATNLDRMINVYGTVNICDHKTGGEYAGKIITNRTNTGKTGGIFYCQNSATGGYGVFNLYGGILTSTGKMKNGGICGLGNALNMYDGIITGGKASGQGGNIYMETNSYALFNMYGGTVSNGEAAGGGGNLRVGHECNLLGGTITGGVGTGSGGNMRVNSGTLTIDGVTITNGRSTSYNGGNIFNDAGTVVIKSGTITGGTAVNGGNMCLKRASDSIANCTIYGGTASGLGGDIYFEKADGTLTISGTINTNGTELQVYVAAGTLNTTNLSDTVKIKVTYA